MVFQKQYEHIKGVVFEAMILEAVTLKIEHGFVEWFELETQVSHLLVRY